MCEGLNASEDLRPSVYMLECFCRKTHTEVLPGPLDGLIDNTDIKGRGNIYMKTPQESENGEQMIICLDLDVLYPVWASSDNLLGSVVVSRSSQQDPPTYSHLIYLWVFKF